jgi:leucyl-tRNA synthetase
MILGELEFTKFVDAEGQTVSAEHVRSGEDVRSGRELRDETVAAEAVTKRGDHFVLIDDETVRVDARAHKMSKSRGNVVAPDEVIAAYGADAFRLYEMFMGPLEQVKPWNTRGVEGTHRFLNRVWRLIAATDGGGLKQTVQDSVPSPEQLHSLHQTIAKVTEDIESLRFNTAIAALMEFTNAATKWPVLPRDVVEPFVLILAPLAPHIAEELWGRLGHEESLAYAAWPEFDAELLKTGTIVVPVQVNGKIRGRIEIPADATEDLILTLAREDGNVSRYLQGKRVIRAIYVPGRIVNFVIGN